MVGLEQSSSACEPLSSSSQRSLSYQFDTAKWFIMAPGSGYAFSR